MYVKKGISEWLPDWKRRGWKTAAKKPVMNQELWEKLDALCLELEPHFEWVEGHAGNPDNERCDSLVKLAIEELLRKAKETQPLP
jgi:ribonuclease HI